MTNVYQTHFAISGAFTLHDSVTTIVETDVLGIAGRRANDVLWLKVWIFSF
jgi:hypothetical protein